MYFGLFSIFVIKPIQPDCDKIKGISVLLLETPLTRSKYFSPYTHAQRLTRTSITFCTFTYKQTLHWWRIRCPVEGEKFWIWIVSSVADCVHTAIFQNIRENRVPYLLLQTKSREKSTHTRISDLHLQRKIDK